MIIMIDQSMMRSRVSRSMLLILNFYKNPLLFDVLNIPGNQCLRTEDIFQLEYRAQIVHLRGNHAFKSK